MDGKAAAASDEDGSNRHERRHEPDAETSGDERDVFAEQQPLERAAAESRGAEQRQLTAPLEDVPRDDRHQADDAEHEAQAAECLERGEVRVFDLMVRVELACGIL